MGEGWKFLDKIDKSRLPLTKINTLLKFALLGIVSALHCYCLLIILGDVSLSLSFFSYECALATSLISKCVCVWHEYDRFL